METKSQSGQRKTAVLLAVLLVLLAAALAALVVLRGGKATDIQDEDTPRIGYAEGVTVADDPNALQNAVDEMYAKAAEGSIALEYTNEASSEDGRNFSCYIANAAANRYDMYIDIYSDLDLTDEIYLSGLIRPGYAFRDLTLDNALEPGTHTVYVAFTQVEEDLATIHGQVIVTMDFVVTE